MLSLETGSVSGPEDGRDAVPRKQPPGATAATGGTTISGSNRVRICCENRCHPRGNLIRFPGLADGVSREADCLRAEPPLPERLDPPGRSIVTARACSDPETPAPTALAWSRAEPPTHVFEPASAG